MRAPLQNILETEAFSHLGPGSGRLHGREAQATDGGRETNSDPLILTFREQMGCGARPHSREPCVRPPALPSTARTAAPGGLLAEGRTEGLGKVFLLGTG